MNGSSHLFIDRSEAPGLPTLQLVGDLDMHTRQALEYRLKEMRQQGYRHVGLDLRRVKYLDSMGISSIVAAYEESRRTRRELVIVDASEGVRRVFGILNLQHMLQTPA